MGHVSSHKEHSSRVVVIHTLCFFISFDNIKYIDFFFTPKKSASSEFYVQYSPLLDYDIDVLYYIITIYAGKCSLVLVNLLTYKKFILFSTKTTKFLDKVFWKYHHCDPLKLVKIS